MYSVTRSSEIITGAVVGDPIAIFPRRNATFLLTLNGLFRRSPDYGLRGQHTTKIPSPALVERDRFWPKADIGPPSNSISAIIFPRIDRNDSGGVATRAVSIGGP